MLRNYRCDVCDRKFTKASNLARHRLVHSKDKPFECAVCSLRFTQKSSLQRHCLLHSGEKSFKCSKCSMRFAQRGNLQTHIRRVHPRDADLTNKFPCLSCSCVFNKLNSLNRHSAKLHSSKLPKIIEDIDEDSEYSFDKVMLQLKSLQNNMRLNFITTSDNSSLFTNDNTNIPINEAIFNLQKNIGIDTQKRSYVKKAQTQNAPKENSEVVVKRIEEATKKNYYACNICSKRFTRPYDLLRHIRVYTNEKPFECGICGRCFALKSNLQVHLRVHGKQKDRITNCYQCPECFMQFSSLRQLDIHAKSHTKSKLFRCKFCNKGFATTNNLRIHENLHRKKSEIELQMLKKLQEPLRTNTSTVLEDNQNDRQYQCSICGIKFKRLAHLSQHELSHSGRKPHQCLTCRKCFTVRGSLNLHQKIHSGHKTKACDECDSKFRSNTELKRHKAVHSTVRSFACPYCHKSFKTRGTCKAHITTHLKHLGETNETRIGELIENDITKQLNNISSEQLNSNSIEMGNIIYLDIGDDMSQSESTNVILRDAETCVDPSGSSKFIEIDELIQKTSGKSLSTTITVQSAKVPLASEMSSISAFAVPEIPSDRKHICETCERAFKKPIDLRRHMRTHTKEKPFECDVCKASFRLKCTLDTHKLVHEKDRTKFDCQVCGKTYASQNVLNVHIRIHTNERPYNCNYCCKTFRTTGHKDAHHRMHTKIPRKSTGQKRKLKKNYCKSVEAVS